MADTKRPHGWRNWRLEMPATANSTTRTVRLTEKGRKYVEMMRRRDSLKRAEQAASTTGGC